ncbi:MAG: hypothetical protein AABX13_01035 [Nanoarchaeota archaeon]
MAKKEEEKGEKGKVEPLGKEGKAEKVGYHKGSLSVLSKEREELLRILQIVEQLMQMHVKELKEMGVDLAAQAKEVAKQLKGKKPIEEVLR